MLVLIMGHRRGISKVLENLGISYVVWNDKAVLGKLSTKKIIIKPYPETRDRLLLEVSQEVTHVIAGTESAVIPASKARIWLDARRNPHSLILRCTDKFLMKEYLSKKDIPMTPFARAKSGARPEAFFDKLGKPLIVKPRKSSGSRGVAVVSDPKEFSKYVTQKMILEKKVEGREGSVESIIQNGEIHFTNITGYKTIGHCNLVPGHYGEDLKKEILELNQKVIKALKISWGLTHMEFYETSSGILFGEVALRPPGGYIMECIGEAYNHDFWEFFVKVELGIEIEKPLKQKMFTAAIVMHPSQGVVAEIAGLEFVKSLQSIKKIKVKVKIGDEVSKRAGLGEDVGHAILSNSSREKLLDDLDAYKNKFKIILA